MVPIYNIYILIHRMTALPLIAQHVGCDLEDVVHLIIYSEGLPSRRSGSIRSDATASVDGSSIDGKTNCKLLIQIFSSLNIHKFKQIPKAFLVSEEGLSFLSLSLSACYYFLLSCLCACLVRDNMPASPVATTINSHFTVSESYVKFT